MYTQFSFAHATLLITVKPMMQENLKLPMLYVDYVKGNVVHFNKHAQENFLDLLFYLTKKA